MAAFNWRFDWDPEKALGNLAKHGISFEQAATVLKDPLAISIFDDEHSEVEDRWITLGVSSTGITLVVVHTVEQTGPDSSDVRLISARRATRAEMRDYREVTP